MRLDDLALPLRIEQIGEALRCLFLLHQVGVVGDHAQEHAEAREVTVGVLVLGRIEFRDIFRNVGRKHALILPVDEMRRIRRVDHVNRMHIGRVFLTDTLQQPLGARALDLAGNSGIFRLERLADLL